jgi:hypothetical protein
MQSVKIIVNLSEEDFCQMGEWFGPFFHDLPRHKQVHALHQVFSKFNLHMCPTDLPEKEEPSPPKKCAPVENKKAKTDHLGSDEEDDEDVCHINPENFLVFRKKSVQPEKKPIAKKSPQKGKEKITSTQKSKSKPSDPQSFEHMVTIHAGYSSSGETEMSDIISGDTEIISVQLKELGLRKGKYGGMSGVYLLPSCNRECVTELLEKCKIGCKIEKWQNVKSQAPREGTKTEIKSNVTNANVVKKFAGNESICAKTSPPEKPAIKTPEPESSPKEVPQPKEETKTPVAKVTISSNKWGNKWHADTYMVFAKNAQGKQRIIGCQDVDSTEKGLGSVIPLTENHKAYCLKKGWAYDTGILDEYLKQQHPEKDASMSIFG